MSTNVTVTAQALHDDGSIASDVNVTVTSPDGQSFTGQGQLTHTFPLTITPLEAGTIMEFTAQGDRGEEAANARVAIAYLQLEDFIWWFKNAEPANYATKVQVRVLPDDLSTDPYFFWNATAGYQTYSWSDSSQSGLYQFQNDSDWGATATTHLGGVLIRSIGASTDKNDCEVQCVIGGETLTRKFEIRRPVAEFATYRSQDNFTSFLYPYGDHWFSWYIYTVKDQFGARIPFPLVYHEEFSDHQHSATYPTTWWPMPVETNGATGTDTVSGAKIEPYNFLDTQAAYAEAVNNTGITLVTPADPNYATTNGLIADTFRLIWYAGSASRGEGIEMIRVRITRTRGGVIVTEETPP